MRYATQSIRFVFGGHATAQLSGPGAFLAAHQTNYKTNHCGTHHCTNQAGQLLLWLTGIRYAAQSIKHMLRVNSVSRV